MIWWFRCICSPGFYFCMTDVAPLAAITVYEGWQIKISPTWSFLNSAWIKRHMFLLETNCKVVGGETQNEEEQRSAFLLVLRDSEKHTADRTEASWSSGKHRVSRSKQEAVHSARGQFTAQTHPSCSVIDMLYKAVTCFLKMLAFWDGRTNNKIIMYEK